MASPATSHSRRPARVSSSARCVTLSPRAHDSSMTAISSSSLTQRARCMTVSPSTGSTSGRCLRSDSMRHSGA